MDNARPPCFFFSYARKDYSPWLVKFFEDLKDRVEQKGRLSEEHGEVSFRDIDNIEPGMDWDKKLAEALAKCFTMVSIYTPWYFHRPYCGKEFQVFLDRQPGVTYDAEGAAQNSDKIIPVLWESMADLKFHELPPVVARFIEFSLSEHHELYKKRGLRYIRIKSGPRGPYTDIIEELAGALVRRARQAPLNTLPHPPSLARTRNAFERPSPVPQVSDMSADSMLFVYLTAGGLNPPASRTGRYGTSHPGDWRPFEIDNQDGLRIFVKETASILGFNHFVEPAYYDLAEANVADKILDDIREATNRNAITVLLLDPWFLKTACRNILGTILADETWSGGLIVPVDGKDAETIQLLQEVEESWWIPASSAYRILLSTPRGTIQEFQDTFLALLTELQKRVVTTGHVPERLPGPGRLSTPQLRGPAERQSRER